MDTQYSSGMAKAVKRLYLYDAPTLDDVDLTVSFNKFAAQNTARAANASFGECEAAASLGGSMAADDNSFMQAAAQGQTVFVSSATPAVSARSWSARTACRPAFPTWSTRRRRRGSSQWAARPW